MLLVQVGEEISVMPAVTAVLYHHSAMDIWTEVNDVSTGYRGNGGSACSYCSTVTSVQWIHGLRVMLLVQGRGKWLFCLQLLQYCYITVL